MKKIYSAAKKLLKYHVRDDGHITVYYVIRLINDSNKCLVNLSIKEHFSSGVLSAKVMVVSKCETILPDSDDFFSLSEDGEILNCESYLEPFACCNIMITAELTLINKFLGYIENCVTIDADTFDSKCKHGPWCAKCFKKYQSICCGPHHTTHLCQIVLHSESIPIV